VTAMGMIENLVSVVSTWTQEVAQLRSDNQELRKEIKSICGRTGPSGPQSSMTIKESTDGSLHPQSLMSYRDMLSRSLNVCKECAISNTSNACSSMSTTAVVSKDVAISEAANKTESSDGFVTVSRKKWHEVTVASPPVNPKLSKKHRTSTIVVRNSSLVTISKRVKAKLLFVLCFSPNITSYYIEESEQTAQTFLISLHET
jgi:hypothetical protein